ncbi:hypothetical protein [Amycolatopsis viridis]|uniref:Uncharacterized protein n=1 Tax=Amycolatopsis viridis TaxID=185678 RepID=A0ABX0SSI1_9PSEU|nr:hypothetical protein [Amycolatopsis viridis]NIH78445.1 hypothetical protein [Amycolatopsis viridis]
MSASAAEASSDLGVDAAAIPVNRRPLSASSDCVLTRDLVERRDYVMTTSGAAVIGAYQNADGTLSASVIENGFVRTLHRDQDTGHWTFGPAAEGGRRTEVVVARTPDGRLWTITVDDQRITFFRANGDGFAKVHEEKIKLVGLKVVYLPGPGPREPSIFAAGKDGNLQRYRYAGGDSWKRDGYDVDGALAKWWIWTVIAFRPGQFEVAWCNDTELVRVELHGGKTGSTHKTKFGAHQKMIVRGSYVDAGETAGYLCIDDETNTVHQFRDGKWTALGVSGPRLTAIGDNAGMTKVYINGNDVDGLRLLRQTGWTDNGPAWATEGGVPVAVPIGSASESDLYYDPLHQSVPRFFTVEFGDHHLVLRQQDPDTGTWSGERVRVADTAVAEVRYWRIRVVLRDVRGTPAGQYPVRLRTTTSTEVVVNGKVVRLGPGRDEVLETRTNRLGAVTVSVRADSFTPPAILVAADGLPDGAQIHPAQHVHDYLAGIAPLPDRGMFTADTLRTARVGGHKLIPTASSWSDRKAQEVFDHLRDLLALGNPTLPRPKGSWVLELSPTGEISVNDVDDEAPSLEGFGGDVARFFTDVVAGVLSGVTAVTRLALDASTSTVSLTVSIAGKAIRIGQVIVRTAGEAVDLFLSAMRALGAVTERVLEWLVHRIPFAQIWETKLEVEDKLDALPAEMTRRLTEIKATARQQLTAFARDHLDPVLTQLVTRVGANPVSAVKGSSHDPVPPVVAGGSGANLTSLFHVVDQLVSAPSNWLIDLVTNHAEPLGGSLQSAITAAARQFGPAAESTMSHVTEHLAAFEAAATAFATSLRGAIDENNGHLQTVALSVVLGGVKQFALALVDVAKALVDALLDLLVKLSSFMQSVFDLPVGIKTLDEAAHYIARHANTATGPLTVKGMFGLLVAFPNAALTPLPTEPGSPGERKALDLSLGIVSTVLEAASDLLPIAMVDPITKKVATGMSLLLLCATSFGVACEVVDDEPGPDRAKWMIDLISLGVDLGIMIVTAVKHKDRALVAKLEGTYGVWLDSVAGLASLTAGLWSCASKKASCLEWANTTTGAFPTATAFLRSPELWEEMLPVKVLTSYAAGVATVVTRALMP